MLLLESVPSALLQRVSSSPSLQQIIYSYNDQAITLKNQIQNLQREKETLEMQVKSIGEGEFSSASEELFQLQQEKELFKLQQEKELFTLQQEKETLEMQVKPSEGGFASASEELFQLQQEKETLEMQVKLVNDQTNMTQLLGEIKTAVVEKNYFVILLVTILAFTFSVLLVFIRESFLKEQN